MGRCGLEWVHNTISVGCDEKFKSKYIICYEADLHGRGAVEGTLGRRVSRHQDSQKEKLTVIRFEFTAVGDANANLRQKPNSDRARPEEGKLKLNPCHFFYFASQFLFFDSVYTRIQSAVCTSSGFDGISSVIRIHVHHVDLYSGTLTWTCKVARVLLT